MARDTYLPELPAGLVAVVGVVFVVLSVPERLHQARCCVAQIDWDRIIRVLFEVVLAVGRA